MKKKFSRAITFMMICVFALSAVTVSSSALPIEGATPSGISFDTLEDEINGFMESRIGAASPGAAVAVVKDGEIIFTGAYGLADIERNIAVTEETVFEYGSISKLFVWISVMQLAEQGKLDLDEDVRTYLPDEFNEKWKTEYPVTMRNIQNHASGFGEYPFDTIAMENTGDVDLPGAILILHPHQYFKPGTASVYSNYATALAGYIVECISGKAFYQYQRDNIFDVAGMADSAGHPYWEDNISVLEHKALGYTGDGKGNFKDTGWSYVAAYPSGSINGTVADLARFAIALMPEPGLASPLFQNPDTIGTMLSPSYEEGGSGTAHGFFQLDSATVPAYGHGGNTVSFSSQLVFVPEERFGLVVLTNAGGEMDILFGLQNLLVGNKAAEPSPDPDMPDAHTFEGSYVSMRRAEKTQVEFFHYLSLGRVTAIDNNTVKLDMMGLSGEYVQIAPYTFAITESSAPILRAMLSKFTFKIENGVPTQIMFGNGLDLSSLPSHRSPINLILSVVLLIASALFFLIVPIVLLVGSIRKRGKAAVSNKKLSLARAGLTLCGTALLVNNIIMLVLILMDQLMSYSKIFPFGVANYVLAAISIGMLVFGIANIKNTKSKQKIGFFIITFMLAVFIILLIVWNMFVIYF